MASSVKSFSTLLSCRPTFACLFLITNGLAETFLATLASFKSFFTPVSTCFHPHYYILTVRVLPSQNPSLSWTRRWARCPFSIMAALPLPSSSWCVVSEACSSDPVTLSSDKKRQKDVTEESWSCLWSFNVDAMPAVRSLTWICIFLWSLDACSSKANRTNCPKSIKVTHLWFPSSPCKSLQPTRSSGLRQGSPHLPFFALEICVVADSCSISLASPPVCALVLIFPPCCL